MIFDAPPAFCRRRVFSSIAWRKDAHADRGNSLGLRRSGAQGQAQV